MSQSPDYAVNPSIVRQLGRPFRPSLVQSDDHTDPIDTPDLGKALRLVARAEETIALLEERSNAFRERVNDLERHLEETTSERNLLYSKLQAAERSLLAEGEWREKQSQLVKEHEAHSKRLADQLTEADKKISDLTAAIVSAFGALELRVTDVMSEGNEIVGVPDLSAPRRGSAQLPGLGTRVD